MEHEYQRDLRREAALSFFDSLDQLQKTLNDTDARNHKSDSSFGAESSSTSGRKQPKSFDLTDLEQAAADIEQFFQSKYPKSTDFKD